MLLGKREKGRTKKKRDKIIRKNYKSQFLHWQSEYSALAEMMFSFDIDLNFNFSKGLKGYRNLQPELLHFSISPGYFLIYQVVLNACLIPSRR